ncbi:MAG: 2-oxoglutarate and iron-dependent oxygenase domain-containing protein [Pseudomonadota bacterium]
MIANLDLEKLDQQDLEELRRLQQSIGQVGFLTVHNTGLDAARMQKVLSAYLAFFHLPESDKRRVDMALTGSNRGWGRAAIRTGRPECQSGFQRSVRLRLRTASG